MNSMMRFLVAVTQLYKRLCPSVRPSVRPSVMIELESVKTRISAPAHPSATGIDRVSDLVLNCFSFFLFKDQFTSGPLERLQRHQPLREHWILGPPWVLARRRSLTNCSLAFCLEFLLCSSWRFCSFFSLKNETLTYL